MQVHAKTTLTVILPRFNPVPAGKMARTGSARPVLDGIACVSLLRLGLVRLRNRHRRCAR